MVMTIENIKRISAWRGKASLMMILVIAAAYIPATADDETPRIAVYVTGGRDAGENKAFTTLISDALIRSGKYVAIERYEEFIAQVDAEQTKQRSGAVDDNEIRRIGIQAGVQFVCVADITRAFGTYQISARIIDVETAKVMALGVSKSDMESMGEIERVSEEIVVKMIDPKAAKSLGRETETGGSTEKKQIYRRNSAGLRAGFGSAMNIDGQLTFINKGKNRRNDLMVGYCGVNYQYRDYNLLTNTTTREVSKYHHSFEMVATHGWPIEITSTGSVVGNISMVAAFYWGDPKGFGTGGQFGVDYILEDFIIGMDFRPMYCFYPGGSRSNDLFERQSIGRSGFTYTIGLSAKYRI